MLFVARVLLAAEVALFAVVYLFGDQGLQVWIDIYQANEKLDHDIAVLQQEVVHLEKEIVAWQSDPFYREKIAREKLQMAMQYDEIFFIQENSVH